LGSQQGVNYETHDRRPRGCPVGLGLLLLAVIGSYSVAWVKRFMA
jgi:hypothetical protein